MKHLVATFVAFSLLCGGIVTWAADCPKPKTAKTIPDGFCPREPRSGICYEGEGVDDTVYEGGCGPTTQTDTNCRKGTASQTYTQYMCMPSIFGPKCVSASATTQATYGYSDKGCEE